MCLADYFCILGPGRPPQLLSQAAVLQCLPLEVADNRIHIFEINRAFFLQELISNRDQ